MAVTPVPALRLKNVMADKSVNPVRSKKQTMAVICAVVVQMVSGAVRVWRVRTNANLGRAVMSMYVNAPTAQCLTWHANVYPMVNAVGDLIGATYPNVPILLKSVQRVVDKKKSIFPRAVLSLVVYPVKGSSARPTPVMADRT